MIGPSRGYVGRRASQSVGCGGHDAYAHKCMGRGVVAVVVAVVVVVMVVVRASDGRSFAEEKEGSSHARGSLRERGLLRRRHHVDMHRCSEGIHVYESQPLTPCWP